MTTAVAAATAATTATTTAAVAAATIKTTTKATARNKQEIIYCGWREWRMTSVHYWQLQDLDH